MKFRLSALLCLLSLCFSVPASAQLALPDALDSPFDSSARETGMTLTLLQPFRGSSMSPGIAIGGFDEKTVHTVREGQGVIDDLHANGRFIAGRATLGKSPHAPTLVFRQQHIDSAGQLDENRTQVSLRGHEDQPEARLLWPVGHGTVLSLGYGQSDSTFSGSTNLYANVFGIFPQTPPFQFRKTIQTTTLGIVTPVGARGSAELLLGHEDAPGRLSLLDPNSATEIDLPLQDRGIIAQYAARYRASSHATLYAAGERGNYSGAQNVMREGGRPIGQANTARHEEWAGIGASVDLGHGSRLQLFHDYTQSRWQTAGKIPNPADLGVSVNLASDLSYGAGYTIQKHDWGVTWDRAFRADHALRLSYRWATLDARGAADYNLRAFLLPVGGETSLNGSGLGVHLLQVRYRFPVLGMASTLTADQAIPSSTSSGSGGGGAGPSPGRRSTSGGWRLSWAMEYHF